MKMGSVNEEAKARKVFDKIFDDLGLEQDLAGGRSEEDIGRMDAKFEKLFKSFTTRTEYPISIAI